ncbi:hypothetical protein JIG36_21005 [Actinoplanes sp. LDG1-06]|uniref:Uncharacterized protein n=1 Tax=Paractinoplanes ovalisporus TaxID=2810368 RepID=A0ABS2AF87_9ACTN|nr:DUF6226 family protein [Actinoplanes ovalisporus]MBM2618038.1 hypothetical protein [Actinoplanes ovalisporus]
MRADPHAARFAVLHDAAEALLDELAERYTVDRRESKELLGPADALVRMERLMPRTPAAAPLAVAFTEAPGLALRLGRWWVETLPMCACEVCDEDPSRLVEVLRTQASALVEGGLWERVRRGVGGSWFESRLIGDGINARRDGPLTRGDAREARRSGFAAAVQWAPWPHRATNLSGSGSEKG